LSLRHLEQMQGPRGPHRSDADRFYDLAT